MISDLPLPVSPVSRFSRVYYSDCDANRLYVHKTNANGICKACLA